MKPSLKVLLTVPIAVSLLISGCSKVLRSPSAGPAKERAIIDGTALTQAPTRGAGMLMKADGKACSGVLLCPTLGVTVGHCTDAWHFATVVDGTNLLDCDDPARQKCARVNGTRVSPKAYKYAPGGKSGGKEDSLRTFQLNPQDAQRAGFYNLNYYSFAGTAAEIPAPKTPVRMLGYGCNRVVNGTGEGYRIARTGDFLAAAKFAPGSHIFAGDEVFRTMLTLAPRAGSNQVSCWGDSGAPIRIAAEQKVVAVHMSGNRVNSMTAIPLPSFTKFLSDEIIRACPNSTVGKAPPNIPKTTCRIEVSPNPIRVLSGAGGQSSVASTTTISVKVKRPPGHVVRATTVKSDDLTFGGGNQITAVSGTGIANGSVTIIATVVSGLPSKPFENVVNTCRLDVPVQVAKGGGGGRDEQPSEGGGDKGPVDGGPIDGGPIDGPIDGGPIDGPVDRGPIKIDDGKLGLDAMSASEAEEAEEGEETDVWDGYSELLDDDPSEGDPDLPDDFPDPSDTGELEPVPDDFGDDVSFPPDEGIDVAEE